MKKLIIFLLLALPGTAQVVRPIKSGAADPSGTCNVSTLYIQTTSHHLWMCVLGVWTDTGGGGGGTPAAPFNSVQFNNAGAFGGDSGFTYAGSGVFAVGPPIASFDTFSQGYLATTDPEVRVLNAGTDGNSALVSLKQDNTAHTFYGHFSIANATNPIGVNKVFVGAVSGDAYQNGAGNIGNLFGLTGEVFLEGTGAITNAAGIESFAEQDSSGAITNMIGVWAQTNFPNGAAENNYGIKVDDQSGATIGNWAIKTGVGKVEFGDVVQSASVVFASLPTPTNGMQIYCSDCKVTSGVDDTCANTGSGAVALRINGAWKCVQ